ncbi:hypothetical protein KIPB_006330, partial [Kipferlia bialata]|eukprot:g6330.t1
MRLSLCCVALCLVACIHAFECPASDPPTFMTDAIEYVCPPGTDGGYPLEWLGADNAESVPVSYQNNQDLTMALGLVPSAGQRLSVYFGEVQSTDPTLLAQASAIYMWTWALLGGIVLWILAILYIVCKPGCCLVDMEDWYKEKMEQHAKHETAITMLRSWGLEGMLQETDTAEGIMEECVRRVQDREHISHGQAQRLLAQVTSFFGHSEAQNMTRTEYDYIMGEKGLTSDLITERIWSIIESSPTVSDLVRTVAPLLKGNDTELMDAYFVLFDANSDGHLTEGEIMSIFAQIRSTSCRVDSSLSEDDAASQIAMDEAKLRRFIENADTVENENGETLISVDEFRAGFTRVIKMKVAGWKKAKTTIKAAPDFFEGCCTCCDLSGKQCIDVRYLDGRTRDRLKEDEVQKGVLRTGKQEYVLVKKQKTGSGGFVSIVFAIIYLIMGGAVAMLVVRTPTPTLPSHITDNFAMDSLLQRQVSNPTLGSLTGFTPTL